MKYMGSKNRIAKYILPIMLQYTDPQDIFYDVCCGGANLIDKVNNYKKIAIDNNEFLIEALKLIRDNPECLPKNNTETNESIYKSMKTSHDKAMKGYYGFALSYGGKWFGGWRRDKEGKRDYIAESYRGALSQSNNIQDVEFICAEYDEVQYTKNSIIYIDPPYQGTTKYKNSFDHKVFWEWCRVKGKSGYKVFISEYEAPEDFKCLWEKEITSSLTKDTGNKKGIEKLFTCCE